MNEMMPDNTFKIIQILGSRRKISHGDQQDDWKLGVRYIGFFILFFLPLYMFNLLHTEIFFKTLKKSFFIFFSV